MERQQIIDERFNDLENAFWSKTAEDRKFFSIFREFVKENMTPLEFAVYFDMVLIEIQTQSNKSDGQSDFRRRFKPNMSVFAIFLFGEEFGKYVEMYHQRSLEHAK